MKALSSLLILFTLVNMQVFSQKIFDLNQLESDISFLNQKIIKLAQNSPYDLHVKDSQIQHVYHLNLDGEFSKERFNNKQFINSLYASYYSQKRLFKSVDYLHAESLICDDRGKLIFTSNGVQIFENNIVNPAYDTIAKLLFEKELDYCFHINNTSVGTYFGVKGTQVFILSDTFSRNKICYPLEEFIELYWDKFVPFKTH